jgi:hypothetical protein
LDRVFVFQGASASQGQSEKLIVPPGRQAAIFNELPTNSATDP